MNQIFPNRNRSGYRSSYGRNARGESRGGGFQRGRFRNRGPRNPRFVGDKINHQRYIAKAIASEPEPTMYITDKKCTDFDLSDILKRNITNRNYINPTKIQAEAIPAIIAGKDVLAMASTGSGKTAAFLIPMINKVLKDSTQKCLIIVPTRELATQIQNELSLFAKATNISHVLIIGGENMRGQIYALKKSPKFVIGTPGRLKDLFKRKAIDLGGFNNIVLDEVDRMLDMGFIQDIKLLISQLRIEKQTLFFSATITSQCEIIAKSLLKNPVRIEVKSGATSKNVDQDIVKVKPGGNKVEVLHELLIKQEFEKVLIFSKTKRGADTLSKELFARGFKVDSIHGDKTQARRTKVISLFRQNVVKILVATDVAARGLDIANITHVINFDQPATYNDYIHRIGRTGRIGKKGVALTFV